jgi:hypothetical protein
MRRLAVATLAMAACVLSAEAQAQAPGPARPTADVYIRSQAGLPPSSARGEIEVVDLGSHELDIMLSIVGHRTATGWRVSYVCAQSPGCDPKRFVLAKDFALTADADKRLDAVLGRLKAEPDAETPATAPNMTCPHLAVAIDDRGFKRRYTRGCDKGADLGELEALLKGGLP